MPRIIPRRTMRLEDERVEAGKAVEVSEAAAELALRHGWADEAPAKAPRKPAAAPAPVANADPATALVTDGAAAASQADQAPQE